MCTEEKKKTGDLPEETPSAAETARAMYQAGVTGNMSPEARAAMADYCDNEGRAR